MDQVTDDKTVTIDMPQGTETIPVNTTPAAEPILQPTPIIPTPQPVSTPTEIPPKPKLGAPCKFCKNEDFVMKKVNDYLAKCKNGNDGKTIMPYLEELCLELDIDEDTISNWAHKKKEDGELEHPIFFGAYKRVRMYQKLRLLQRTLGRSNPAGAIFQLKANHNMIESEKRIIAGDEKEPLTINIVESVKHEE